MQELIGILLAPFSRLVQFGDPFSALSIATALLFAVFLLRGSMAGPVLARARALVAQILPSETLQLSSFHLDLKLFVLNSILFAAAAAWFGFSEQMWRASAFDGWRVLLGFQETAESGRAWAIILATLMGFIAFELGYWVAHWICHKIPLLWRFHELHHSAPIMTPITGLRQHPVEVIIFATIVGVSVGTGEAFLAAIVGAREDAISCFSVNVFVFLYVLTIQHLRHSPLWMPLPGWAGLVLQSPAHHQLHHSRLEVFQHRNLGFALTVFDWLFGTLSAPTEQQPAAIFGTTQEAGENASLWQAFISPMKKKPRQ